MEEQLKQILENQFNTVISDLELTDYKIYISSEQLFKNDLIRPNEIFILYKESSGQQLYNNRTSSISFYILSEQNSLDIAKNIVDTFINLYNQIPIEFYEKIDNKKVLTTIYPLYTTAVVANNFIRAGLGMRSMIYMTCSIVVSKNLNDINQLDYIHVENGVSVSEKINFLSLAYSYSAFPDSQPNFSNNTNVSTIMKHSSFTMTFAVQFTNSSFIKKVNKIIFRKYQKNEDNVNDTITFKLTLADGSVIELPLKLYSMQLQKNLGALTSVNLSFTQ